MQVQRQMKSLFILNSFTWSKAFDLAAADGEEANGDSNYVNFTNIRGDAGVSGYNQPLNDSLALTWEIPFGQSSWAHYRVAKQTFGGWELTAINRMTSGLPINLTYDPSTTALTTDLGYSYRPNITGNLQPARSSMQNQCQQDEKNPLNQWASSPQSGFRWHWQHRETNSI